MFDPLVSSRPASGRCYTCHEGIHKFATGLCVDPLLGQLVHFNWSRCRYQTFRIGFDHFRNHSIGRFLGQVYSLCPVSVSLILLQTDFSIFSEISEKSLSEILGAFSVLKLAASGSTIGLAGESNLASFLDVLSGIFGFRVLKIVRVNWSWNFGGVLKKLRFQILYFIRTNGKSLAKKNFQLKLILLLQIFIPFRPRVRGKIRTPFTPRSARRPSEAGKPEAQFSFVELRLSVCSCIPGKHASISCLSCLLKKPKLNVTVKTSE